MSELLSNSCDYYVKGQVLIGSITNPQEIKKCTLIFSMKVAEKGGVDFMRLFHVAMLSNGVFIVTCEGFELPAPKL